MVQMRNGKSLHNAMATELYLLSTEGYTEEILPSTCFLWGKHNKIKTMPTQVRKFLFVCLFRDKERVRTRGREREREGERESQAGSMLSTEPNVGLNPMTLGS